MARRRCAAAHTGSPAPVAAATAIAALTLPLLCGGGACSRPTDTQPYAGGCDPFYPVSFVPVPDSRSVPRDSPIRVTFNDYPDPDTLGPASFLLTTGVFWYTGSYAVDLPRKAIVFRPVFALRGELGYTMSVLPALRSLSGCATTTEQRNFRTSTALLEPPEPAPVAFAGVAAIFGRSCAGAACHRAPDGACLRAPAEGLSLCDADARQALIGIPSRQVNRLHLVEPRDSARSYLLRKLLTAADGTGPLPTVLGHREPAGGVLPPGEIDLVASWIDSGAGD